MVARIGQAWAASPGMAISETFQEPGVYYGYVL